MNEPSPFWVERLALVAEPLASPFVRRRSPGGRRSFRRELDGAAASRLLRLVRGEDTGVLTLLFAAACAVLERYTGRDLLVVEAFGLGGDGHRPLPLLQRYPAEGTVGDLLRACRQSLLESWEQRLGLPGPRPGAAGPLLSFLSIGHHAVDGSPGGAPVAELHLCTERDGERLALALRCGEAALEPAVAEAFLDHLERALGSFGRADLPLRDLGLLTAAEERHLTQVLAVSTHERPPEGTLASCFEEQARRTPGAIAVVFGERRLTYAELDRAANALAHQLQRAGAGPERPVLLHAPPSERAIAGILGALKAGAAYVPLERQNPPARLAVQVEAVRPAALLADGGVDASSWFSGPRVRLDQVGKAETGEESARPPPRHDDQAQLAYVMFTSGSTGTPRGVEVEHRSAVRIARDTNFCALGPQSRVLQISNLAFDGSVFEIFGALLNGAELHVVPQEVRESMPDLCRFLHRNSRSGGANGAGFSTFVTASVLNRLVELDPEVIGCFDLLCFGGQVASVRHVRQAVRHQRRPGALVNAYGPTETTVFAAYHPVVEAPPEDAPIPLGRPVGNTRIYVLDAKDRPAPVGVLGEIAIGGCGVGRGYSGDRALTEQRFAPDPFHPGGRIHRTRDLGRWLRDGTLEFAGRRDGLLKLRGYRVEPGEVEQALRRCPGVEEALVLPFAPAGGDEELVAYVQSKSEDAARLRSSLRDLLPEYMVPKRFLFVRFALGPNGKIDRRSLPPPTEADTAAPWVPPSTPTQVRLAAMWREVLGRDRIGAGDDFFDSGGHSLKAAQLTVRLAQELGVEVGLQDFFRHPKLSDLAAHVDTLAAGRPVEIPRAPDLPEHPLSPAQARMWPYTQLSGTGHAVLHIPVALELRGRLDAAALGRAVSALVERHEVLRTRFPMRGGVPFQRIEPARPLPLEPEDVSSHPDPEAELERRLEEESHAPFELSERGPFRARLFRRAADRHVLSLNVHHLAADGQSLGVLLRDLQALYRHHALGSPVELPPLPIQYRDYAHWQRGRWQEGPPQARDYWRRQLAGATQLELPADAPRPALRTFAGGRREVSLGEGARAALRAIADRAGATLFMASAALVKALLYRYTGERDIAVGVPWAGRDRAELADLVGFFINTWVLRDEVDGAEGFSRLVSRVRQSAVEALEHREYPFERVVEDLQVAWAPEHHPLFDVVVSMHDGELPGLLAGERHDLAPGLIVERRPFRYDVSLFDLALGFIDDGRELRLHVEYSTELFTAARIDRMIAHLGRLLESAGQAPDLPLRRLDLLGADEAAWLEQRSRGPAAPHRGETVLDRILAAGEQRPEAVALAGPDATWTYGELLARGRAVARRLLELGVQRGEVVGLAVDRSAWEAPAILGCWQAGAAYAPVDPSLPPARLGEMLARAGARAAVATSPPPAGLDGFRWVDVTALAPEPPGGAKDLPRPRPEELAYVIFTSGSTGRPKGVMVEHRAIASWTLDQIRRQEIGHGDRVLQPFSTLFDPSIFFMGLGLGAGARVVVASLEEANDPLRLGQLLGSGGVTVLATTPSRLLALGSLPPCVRLLISGGEASTFQQLAPYVRGRRFVNQYGPTEATCVTCFHVDAAGGETSTVPIGLPLPGVTVELLDAGGERVPIGIPGELHAAGDGLARGYLGQPAMTAELFLPHRGEPGRRMYRTGDWARWREDGQLEYLGRRDRQVKVRGYRVGLGSIEEELRRQPGVRQAVVLAEGEAGREELAAYLESNEPVDQAGLRARLGEVLPGYMVPARFVVLPKLPLAGPGKLDLGALRSMAVPPAPVAPVERASEPLVEQVRRAFAETLGRDVGLEEEFFHAGGNSLGALRLVALVERRLKVRVPLQAVFRNSTPSRLAEAMRDLSPVVPELIPPAPPAASHPLSHAQLRLWIADQALADRSRLSFCAVCAWSGQVGPDVLEAALGDLLERHEALRTTFFSERGEPRQRIAGGAVRPSLARVDLAAEPHAEDRLRELAREEARAPFPLERGPLLRATLATLPGGRQRLVLAAHHIACDGWGMQVLLHELWALCEARRSGAPPALPPLPIQYKDYARWERDRLSSPAGTRARAWWHQQLRGPLPRSRLPADFPRPASGTWAGAVHGVDLDEALSASLRALATSRGASLYMTVLAGVAALVHRHSGDTELVLGTPSSGREHPDLAPLAGFFINPLALRLKVDPAGSFSDLLEAVKEACLGAYEHQGYPFDLLVAELGHRPPADHAPLFDLGLTWADFGGTPEPGEAYVEEEVLTAAKSDLWFHASDRGSRIRLDVEYRTELFREQTIHGYLRSLVELLERAARAPAEPLPRPETAQAGRYAW